MGMEGSNFSAMEKEMIKLELIEELQHAIDQNYRRLFDAAKDHWEHSFAGKDPSNTCVSVRIGATSAEAHGTAQSRAGYLFKRPLPVNGETLPRSA